MSSFPLSKLWFLVQIWVLCLVLFRFILFFVCIWFVLKLLKIYHKWKQHFINVMLRWFSKLNIWKPRLCEKGAPSWSMYYFSFCCTKSIPLIGIIVNEWVNPWGLMNVSMDTFFQSKQLVSFHSHCYTDLSITSKFELLFFLLLFVFFIFTWIFRICLQL